MKKNIITTLILIIITNGNLAHAQFSQFFKIDGENVTDNKIYSVSYSQGFRNQMEDAFCIDIDRNSHQYSVFELFDGHCGTQTVDYLQKNLWNNVKNKLKEHEPSKYEQIIKEEFLKTGQDIQDLIEKSNQKKYFDGSTALMALIKNDMLFVANVGDGRAILCTKDGFIQVSMDHRASNPKEQTRITSLGGYVVAGRIGLFNISRCFGNYEIAKFVKPEPSLFKKELTKDDYFLILASDGLWDVVSNQQAYTCINDKDKNTLHKKSGALVHLAFTNKTRDNVTVMVIDLQAATNRN